MAKNKLIAGIGSKLSFMLTKMDVFGSDNITVVYVEDAELFTPETLARVEDVYYALQDIPDVLRVDGLFNATNFKGEDGMLTTAPLLDWIPDDPEELTRIRTDARRNPLLNKVLISPDKNAMALTVIVEPQPDDPNFNLRIADEIDLAIEPLELDLRADSARQHPGLGLGAKRRALSARGLRAAQVLRDRRHVARIADGRDRVFAIENVGKAGVHHDPRRQGRVGDHRRGQLDATADAPRETDALAILEALGLRGRSTGPLLGQARRELSGRSLQRVAHPIGSKG